MDTALTLPPPAAAATSAAPAVPRAITTKVQAVDGADGSATLPANKPFVAQVVTARLSGYEFPNNPGEIAPPERTLRPYDMPMLPSDSSDAEEDAPAAQDLTQAEEVPATES
ncbi:MAG: hypothetical protein AAFN63_13020 [Pseudomonadota bacterium]